MTRGLLRRSERLNFNQAPDVATYAPAHSSGNYSKLRAIRVQVCGFEHYRLGMRCRSPQTRVSLL